MGATNFSRRNEGIEAVSKHRDDTLSWSGYPVTLQLVTDGFDIAGQDQDGFPAGFVPFDQPKTGRRKPQQLRQEPQAFLIGGPFHRRGSESNFQCSLLNTGQFIATGSRLHQNPQHNSFRTCL